MHTFMDFRPQAPRYAYAALRHRMCGAGVTRLRDQSCAAPCVPANSVKLADWGGHMVKVDLLRSTWGAPPLPQSKTISVPSVPVLDPQHTYPVPRVDRFRSSPPLLRILLRTTSPRLSRSSPGRPSRSLKPSFLTPLPCEMPVFQVVFYALLARLGTNSDPSRALLGSKIDGMGG